MEVVRFASAFLNPRRTAVGFPVLFFRDIENQMTVLRRRLRNAK
jgi:hypothetical protein